MKKAVLSILLMIAICFNASPCVGFAEEDAVEMEESIQESAGYDAPAHAEPRQESAPIVEATPVESSEEEEFEAIDESQGYGQLSSDDVIIRDYEDEIGSAGEGSEDQEEDAWFFSEQAGTLSRDNDDVYSTEDYSDSEPTTGQIVGMSTGNSLVVGMENPGRVTPGKSLSIHSVVSGGSGNYSYEWNWTHPNGGELKDFRQNCIIYGSVLGTYTFTLTVTDNETGESVTSGKLVVEVKPTNSEYDPMQIHFIGDEDEVEIELAMAGIAAKCDVSGGSGNFEYAWDIFRDGVNLNSYYYGLVEETCTWNVDKVGIYTFQVAVKDRETGLVAVASHSISVVQKEFDPLTVAIISAPAYAKIGEEVFVIAETNGGVGNVLVSWEVYDEKTCVANGDGTKVHFIPTSDEKYTVIVRATDRAQTLEDRVTITAGNLVKCALSASADSMKTGEEINAQVSVRDGIGPFKYEWMLYLNDQFMSSDLNSSSTIYTWTAEQAGTYRITCTVYDLGKEEAEGKLVWATDSVEVVVTSAEQPITVAAPSVTLTVDGIKMTATWPAVEGASRYVYSLRNMATNTNPIDHEDAGSRSITQYLEAGISYKLAVAAVPAGVNDMVNPERCSWTEKEFSIAEISRLDVPDVTLTIDGKTVMATWPAVAGAGRYVYSLRNVTTDEVSIFHEKADSRTITKDLEAGISYKLAVAAVPVGVDDVANPEKCSWTEKSFAIDSEEELNTAKVLSVTCDDAVLQPGESKSMTITCNSATTLLDVYKELPDGTMLDYTTLNNGGAAYSYSVSFAENGKYRLRFVALNHLNDWSRDSANWGYADIIVCDHSTKVEQVSKTNPKYVNSNEHAVTINYREACVCGQVNREYAEEVVEAHTYSTNDIHVEEKHYDGLGHKEFYVCSVCKGSIENGNYRGYKNNTFSYCSVCVQLRLKNYWKLYNGAIDGVCGSGTIGAANRFRNKCGLDNIGTLDDETCRMIMTFDSYPATSSTASTDPIAAWGELKTLLKSRKMSDALFEQLFNKATNYLNDGIISSEDYSDFIHSLFAERFFETQYSLEEPTSSMLALNPEGGSVVGAKVNSQNIVDKLMIVLESGVYDSYQKALDPFFEEFSQTMDVMAEECKSDKEVIASKAVIKGVEINFLKLNNVNYWIEIALSRAYGEEIANEIMTGKKTWDTLSEGASSMYNTIVKQLNKKELRELEKSLKEAYSGTDFIAILGAEEWSSDGMVKVFEAISKDEYIKNQLKEAKENQEGIEKYLTDAIVDSKKLKKADGMSISSKDVKNILKIVGDVTSGIDNGIDFYQMLESRVNLDREKVLAYCNMLDSCTDLTPELQFASKLLRDEVSTNTAERLGAIITEYAINLAVKEVGDAAVKGVEAVTGLDANPYYATMKATAAALNMTTGTKGVISNTRGMTAQYENYASMYENYIRLRQLSEDNPNDAQLREKAKNALILTLLFNIQADEFYWNIADSPDKSFAFEVAKILTGKSYTGFETINDLKDMILEEKAGKKASLALIQNGYLTDELNERPHRVEFSAYAWTEINYDSLFSGDTTRMYDQTLAGTYVYQQYSSSTRYAVDDLDKSVVRSFKAPTVDGDKLEFVELNSTQGKTFIITKNDYERVKASQ